MFTLKENSFLKIIKIFVLCFLFLNFSCKKRKDKKDPSSLLKKFDSEIKENKNKTKKDEKKILDTFKMFAICKNKPYAGKNLTIISYQNNKLIQKIKTKEDDGSFELPNKFNKVEIICENSP